MIDLMRRIVRRLSLLTRVGEHERRVDDEMRFHLDMEAAEIERRGVPASEARRQARVAFGGVERFKEVARDARGTRLLEDLWQDARYAVRQLGHSPAFAAATVLTLALGIGTTTMMWSARRSYTTEGVTLPEPDRLVYVGQGPQGCLACVSLATGNFVSIREQARSLERVSMIADWEPVLRGDAGAELVDAARVSTDFFETLALQPLLGRTFAADDSVGDRSQVVVLSESTWRNRFAADSSALGRTVVLDRVPYAVIGVVGDEAAFWPRGTGMWTPLVLTAEQAEVRGGAGQRNRAVGRLARDATRESASAEVAGIGAQLSAAYPDQLGETGFVLAPLRALELNQLRADPAELIFRAAVGLVLLIACINLAGLLIARLSTRRRELGVRRALGASSARVARQLVVETLMLTAGAALVGVLFAAAGTRLLLGGSLPLDARTFAVALATGLLTGLVIALWPALRFSRPPVTTELRLGSRGAAGSQQSTGARRALVVVEVALAIVVLAAAGVLARSYQAIADVEPGFESDGLLTLRLRSALPPVDRGDADATRFDRLVADVAALPGVERAAATEGIPFGRGGRVEEYEVAGARSADGVESPSALTQAVTSDYFRTLGIPLLRGRAFSDADHADAPAVAVVNRTLAELAFAQQDPLGQTLILDGVAREVVGVSGNVFQGDVENLESAEVYVPMQQASAATVWITLRTRRDAGELLPALTAVLRRFDPDLVLSRTATIEQLRAEDMGSERRMLQLMSAFALASILICAIGLHGLVSYSVSQRAREFGVRVALGAGRASVLSLVLGQGLRLAVIGGALGVAGALLALPLMRSMLFGVTPSDPLTLVVVTLLISGVGVLSAYLPALRATRIDPMTTLGEE
jgi:predicted permease